LVENATFDIIFLLCPFFQTKFAVATNYFCTTFWGGAEVPKVTVAIRVTRKELVWKCLRCLLEFSELRDVEKVPTTQQPCNNNKK